jgi:hypothetical protein
MIRRAKLLPGLALLAACPDEPSCLSGDPTTCEVTAPCQDLAFTCDNTGLTLRQLQPGEPIPGGMSSLASPGDWVLGNDQVQVVIEALNHPHYLGPTGGNILDLGNTNAGNDSLRYLTTVTGLLPGDAPHWDDIRTFDEAEYKAIQVSGALDGYPDIRIITRYEVRPCDPGVRIRTELVNGGSTARPLFLADGWYWGGRENLPFAPTEGGGFFHPSFGLSTVSDALRDVPYAVAAAHVAPAASYAQISCDQPTLTGFHSEEVSAVGLDTRIVMPRDFQIYERFIGVAPSVDVAGAADIALEVRRQLHGEAYTTLTGRVEVSSDDPGGLGANGERASILVSEIGEEGALTPITQVIPQGSGDFSFRVPAGRKYRFQVEAFGRPVDRLTRDVEVGADAMTLEPFEMPDVGTLAVSTAIDGTLDHALVFVVPADEETRTNVTGQLHGFSFFECAPFLGHPHGGSPACNRILSAGEATAAVPPGTYDVYATAGPFSTIAMANDVVIRGGERANVALELTTLPLQPAGTLSGDFHVHGSASFDSSFPDDDRVRAFLASRIQVLATTEHDSISDYGAAMDRLRAHERIRLMTGTESTGHILWPLRTDTYVPKVIGHWNVWPMAYDPEGPWRGAAWDELVEPGWLFTRHARNGWDPATGIIQLNHPWGGIQFGRDYAWGSAMGMDLTKPFGEFDGSGQSLFHHTPEGADFANDAYHVQEVMNGSSNLVFLQYRAIWHELLNRGIVRGGTANSDSHSLAEDVLGSPRTLVWTDTTFGAFDPTVFNRSMREGRMIGTNGPIIEVATTDSAGATVRPSLNAFTPGSSANLQIRVSAAPWVPVTEIRIYVNGKVAKTITELDTPADPFGTEGLLRYDDAVPLSELLAGVSGDAWISVEAGLPLEPNADLDCNGVPDTGDNDRNGTIDWQDVEELEKEPKTECLDTVGPLTEPKAPERDTAAWHFSVVVPGGYPTAFTNPLILDRDGNGYSGVSR